jgi:hypothetical protein
LKDRKIGQVLGININLSVGILSTLALLVVALCLAYGFFPKYRDTVTFVALALTAAATIGGTFYVAETIREQAGERTRAAAFSFVERWNSPSLFYTRQSWHQITEAFQKKEGGGAEGVSKLLDEEGKSQLRHDVRHILNFLEEIAIAIRQDYADEEILKTFFIGVVIRAHEALSVWVPAHRRNTGRPKIWDQFFLLYDSWKSG